MIGYTPHQDADEGDIEQPGSLGVAADEEGFWIVDYEDEEFEPYGPFETLHEAVAELVEYHNFRMMFGSEASDRPL